MATSDTTLSPASPAAASSARRLVRPPASLRRFMIHLILMALLAWTLLCVALFFLQERLIFPRHLMDTTGLSASDTVWQPMERVVLERRLPEGGSVQAWLCLAPEIQVAAASALTATSDSGGPRNDNPNRPSLRSDGPRQGLSPMPAQARPVAGPSLRDPRVSTVKRPIVVFFHGNAELIDDQWSLVQQYHRLGWSVLLVEYRGYGRSGGSPTQAGIVEDAVAFYDQMVERSDVDRRRIVFHGRSLGGAVAAQVALQRRPAGLILESTFASLAAMTWRYGVPPFLLKHPFRTDQAVGQLDIPVLHFQGAEDEVVPISHAHRLRDILAGRAEGAFEYVEYAGVGHNDFPGPFVPDYQRRVSDFLTALPPLPAPPPRKKH